jgi:DnaA family protein
MHLTLRADVVTRLAWGLVYEVHGLSDREKAAALAGHASVRGFALQEDVSNYLLTHARRDMPGLVALLDALDRYSLESQRPVTVPLLRELLAAEQK